MPAFFKIILCFFVKLLYYRERLQYSLFMYRKGILKSMLKIAICDDDKTILTGLGNILKKELKIDFTLKLSDDPARILEYLEAQQGNVDVLILDIELHEANGIDLAAQIFEKYNHMKVIFISAYQDEYFEALFLKMKPYGLLAKPVNISRLILLLEQANRDVDTVYRHTIAIKTNQSVITIDVNRILYVESIKRKVFLRLIDGSFQCYNSLNDIEARLPDSFLRCHKSFIVNMDMITEFTGSKICLQDHTVIPVSQSKASKAKEKYLKYVGMNI